MPQPSHESHAALAEIRDSLLEIYAANDAMNQLILATLDRRAWRAQPPGKRQRPPHRRHLRAPSQLPPGVAENFRAASEMSRAARSRSLHHETSRRCPQKKRRAMPAHVARRSLRRTGSPRHKIFPRQLEPGLARRRHYVRLHVLPRSPPPRPNPDAGPPNGLPHAPRHPRHLALGKTLEKFRPNHPPPLTAPRRPLRRHRAPPQLLARKRACHPERSEGSLFDVIRASAHPTQSSPPIPKFGSVGALLAAPRFRLNMSDIVRYSWRSEGIVSRGCPILPAFREGWGSCANTSNAKIKRRPKKTSAPH